MNTKCLSSARKLFEEDESKETKYLINKIKSEIQACYEDETKDFGSLQKDLIRLRKLQAYENYRLSTRDVV